jgi:hypothetical protein
MGSLFNQPQTRHAITMTLAMSHLALVACGAAHLLPSGKRGIPGSLLQAYTQLAGAHYGYGFFAPGVTSEMRVSFEVDQGPGGVIVREGFTQANHEAKLRQGSMLLMFSFDENQDILARSWAAEMFGRYPDARAVTVTVKTFDPPKMAEYRSGVRPVWKEYYRAALEHQSPSPSNPTVNP